MKERYDPYYVWTGDYALFRPTPTRWRATSSGHYETMLGQQAIDESPIQFYWPSLSSFIRSVGGREFEMTAVSFYSYLDSRYAI